MMPRGADKVSVGRPSLVMQVTLSFFPRRISQRNRGHLYLTVLEVSVNLMLSGKMLTGARDDYADRKLAAH